MQYWLGGTDENIEAMLRFLISRYAGVSEWRGGTVPSPIEYPDVGLYHPDLVDRITVDADELPVVENPIGRVGLLLMRSYVLSGDTAHYDAVLRLTVFSLKTEFQILMQWFRCLDFRW